jgi:transmembrane sensor
VLVVAIGTLLTRRAPNAAAPPTIAVPSVTVATRVGQRDSVRLSDGTRILLGPSSRVSYIPDTRGVALEGFAFFEVTHDAAHPFTVRAGDAVVRDIGTAFTVDAAAPSHVQVVVTEGAGARSQGSDSSLTLRAGDIGTLAQGQPPLVRRNAATPDNIAWTRGRLVFRETRLSDVRTELQRWYGIELVFADSSLRNRTFTNTFIERDSPEQVLRTIEIALGVQIERRGDTAIVRSAGKGRGGR